jgi:hypothetical protein
MVRQIVLYIVIIAFFLGGCSDDHGTSPASFNYDALSAPDSFKITPGSYSLTLNWHYSSENVALTKEFLIYAVYYTEYGEYLDPVDTVAANVGQTDYVDTNSRLFGNAEYCYVLSAVDSSGIEGWRTETKCGITLVP